jgi:hypothetical protein
MVLYSGVGLLALGIFNLLTLGSEDTGCCNQQHDHHTHDHSCDHHHHHSHSCCEHHHHTHEHEHTHVHEEHGHGILEESGSLGRTAAIVILAVPLLIAATLTPDKPSPAWVQKKGLYNQQYGVGSRTEQFSLRGPSKPADTTANAPQVADNEIFATPTDDSQRTPGSGTVVATTANTAKAGSREAKSYGEFTLEDLKAQVPQNKAGDFLLEVPELFYTAGDKEVQITLAGQPVLTTAQVLPEKVNNEAGKRLRIFRLQIQCCAADARPYSIPIEFADKAPTIKDMTWIEVRGHMEYRQENGQTVPLLHVKTYKEAAAPAEIMVY